MQKIKNISVKTTFQVGLVDLEVSEKVLNQLKEMEENNISLDGTGVDYPEANEWFRDNIHISDCYDVEYEIKLLN